MFVLSLKGILNLFLFKICYNILNVWIKLMNIEINTNMEKYPRGRRGSPAKGVGL